MSQTANRCQRRSGIPVGNVANKLMKAAVATASKKGPHAALPAQIWALTPPVFATSVVYSGPEFDGRLRSGYVQRMLGSVGEPHP